MRPTDKSRNQDLARSQGDHSTLYVSLELSRSRWLATSLSPNSFTQILHDSGAEADVRSKERFIRTERA